MVYLYVFSDTLRSPEKVAYYENYVRDENDGEELTTVEVPAATALSPGDAQTFRRHCREGARIYFDRLRRIIPRKETDIDAVLRCFPGGEVFFIEEPWFDFRNFTVMRDTILQSFISYRGKISGNVAQAIIEKTILSYYRNAIFEYGQGAWVRRGYASMRAQQSHPTEEKQAPKCKYQTKIGDELTEFLRAFAKEHDRMPRYGEVCREFMTVSRNTYKKYVALLSQV